MIAGLLDREPEDIPERVRRSLVQIRNGHGGAGAGAIWHPDGLILTNARVVGRGASLVVANGKVHEAKVLALDRRKDLAALSMEGAGRAESGAGCIGR